MHRHLPIFLVGGVAHVTRTLAPYTHAYWDYARCGLEAYYDESAQREIQEYVTERRPVMDQVQDAVEVTCMSCLVAQARGF